MQQVTHLSLWAGRRNEISQRIESWTVQNYEDGPLVELTALTEFDVAALSDAEKHLMATTLAIRMDPKAAIGLAEQIVELARTKGWPLPPTIVFRDAKR